jgi:hypothetical protein
MRKLCHNATLVSGSDTEGLKHGQTESTFEEGAQERSRSRQVRRPEADSEEEDGAADGEEGRAAAGEENAAAGKESRADPASRARETPLAQGGAPSGTSRGTRRAAAHGSSRDYRGCAGSGGTGTSEGQLKLLTASSSDA